ncbi:MAG: translocation/assembly module TamB domain-containing protein [Bryobacteraceae bacterium]|nr:translocation/assembly module TamB domain-containing protein [Bryobacteraceae bacterium]
MRAALPILTLLLAPALFAQPREPIERYFLTRIQEEARKRGIGIEATGVDWNLFFFTVTLHNVRVTSLAEPDLPPLVSMDRAYVNVAFSDLVRGVYTFESVRAQNPRVHLVLDRGRDNIPNVPESKPREKPLELLVRAANIDAGSLIFEDRVRRLRLELPRWRLGVTGRTLPLRHEVKFESSAEGTLVYEGRRDRLQQINAELLHREGLLEVRALKFSVPHTVAAVNGTLRLPEGQPAQTDLRYNAQTDLAPLLRLLGVEQKLAGKAAARGVIRGPFGDLTIEADAEGRGVDFREFTALDLDADVVYRVAQDRVTLRSFSARGPIGAATGEGVLALNAQGGETSLRGTASNVDVERLLRSFKSPVLVASRARGPFTVRWPGTDIDRIRAEGRFQLTATRRAPAEDVLPVSGSVAATVRGRDVVAELRSVQVLGGTAEGSVRLDNFEGLSGSLTVNTADVAPTLAALERFLGRREPLVDIRIAGPVTAKAELGGTVKRPAVKASVASTGMTVAELRDVAVNAEVNYAGDVLALENFAARWRDQVITATGRIGTGGPTRPLELRARVEQGSLAAVLAGLGMDQYRIEGSFNAQAVFGGTVDDPVGSVAASGSGLRIYGENLGAFTAEGRVDKKTFTLDRLRTEQPGGGTVTATGSYSWGTKTYTLTAEGKGVRLQDTELPQVGKVRGVVNFTARGQGQTEKPDLLAQLTVDELVLNGKPGGRLTATLDVTGGAARFEAALPAYGFSATGTLAGGPRQRITVTMNNTDFGKLPFELPRQLQGTASGRVEFDGEVRNWRDARIVGELSALNLKWAEVPIGLQGPARIEYQNRYLYLPAPITLVTGDTRLQLSGALPIEPSGGPGLLELRGSIALASLAPLMEMTEPVAASGQAQVDLLLVGSLNALDPRGTITLSGGGLELPARGVPPFYNLNARITVGDGVATVENLSSDWGPAVVKAAGVFPLGLLPANLPVQIVNARQGPATFAAELTNLQLLAFQQLPNDLGGTVSVRVEGSAPKLALDALQAKATFSELSLQLRNYPLAQQSPTVAVLDKGVLRIPEVQVTGPETKLAIAGTADLISPGRPMDIRLSGTSDASVLFFFTNAVSARGPAQLEVRAGGSVEKPQVTGFVEFNDAQLSMREPRLAWEDLHARVTLNGDRVSIDRMTAALNGGTFTGRGGFRLGRGGIQDSTLAFRAENVYAEFPEGLRTVANADMGILTAGPTMVIDGEVHILEGSYTKTIALEEEVFRRLSGGGQLDLTEERNPFLEDLRFNVRVITDEPIVVDNNFARAEIIANVQLVGTYYRPGFTGRIEIQEGGEIYLAERRYLVDRAVVSFINEQRIEPLFDLLARTQAGGYDITLQLSGALRETQVNLTADDPTLTEPQILALLVTGRRLDDARAASTTVAREQLLSLLAGSLTGRLSREFQQALGVTQLRLEPSLIAPEQNPTARLTVGQDITRQLSFIYSLDLADPGNNIWIAEYDITRRFVTRGIKQEDNTYRMEFRHDVRFGGTPFEPLGGKREERRVGTVQFLGNRLFTDRELQKRFKVEPDDKYNFFKIREGLDRIEKLYAKQNLLESRVRLRREQRGDRVDLRVNIQPGPKLDFVYEGWDVPGGARDDVREIWQRGVFDTQRLDEARARLESELIREKFLRPSVTYSVSTPSASDKRVLFEIQPGVRFGRVQWVFEGAKGIKQGDLRKAIDKADLTTQVYTQPTEVVELLKRYYREEGYLDAEIGSPQYDLNANDRSGRVVFDVTEGPRYRVGSLRFTGNHALTEAELRKDLLLEDGAWYTPRERESAFQQIQERYWEQGYNDVEIGYTVAPREREPLVDVAFRIQEGRRRMVRRLTIAGNEQTSARLIRTQVTFRGGDVLTTEKLSRSRRNLYETGAYRLVEVDVSNVPLEETPQIAENERAVDVTVRVHEVQPFQVRYGGLYDTERGPGVIADVFNYNSLGSARTIGLRARYDSQQKEARFFFSQPLLRRFPLRTVASVYATQNLRDELRIDRVGVSLQEETRFRENYILTFGYRLENTRTREREPDPLFPFRSDVRIAPFSATLTRETRDDILNATTGSFFSQAFEYAPSYFGSQLRYARSFTQFYYYRPLREPQEVPFSGIRRNRWVYASAARVGLASGLGGQELIPAERFFAGGGTTIRGFEQDRVGPLIGDQPLGGEAVLILNNELRFPLYRWFDGVAFVDVGNVWERYSDFSFGDIRKTAGLGLRMRTPYFMLRMDYGHKLDRRAGEVGGRFFFSIGQAF